MLRELTKNVKNSVTILNQFINVWLSCVCITFRVYMIPKFELDSSVFTESYWAGVLQVQERCELSEGRDEVKVSTVERYFGS